LLNLPKPGRAATHDLALADELGVELGAVEREVYVKVDAVKSALRGVHALKVLFEIFAREVRGKGDDFLDAYQTLATVSISRDSIKPTGIFGVLWADVVVTSIQDILIHERRTRRDLSEERDLDWLANLDTLTFLHKNLASVLASVLAVQRGDAVLFWVVAFFERLKCGHEVVSTSDTVRDDSLCDTGCDSALDDSGDGVHGSDDLGLELRGHVEFDLLEEVF